jgi:ubiquinone/menaquinone biosynthesis C-methylase UbiE
MDSGQRLSGRRPARGAAPPDASAPPELERARRQVEQCRDAHAHSGYYQVAEPDMETQWRDLILPLIGGMDFSHVVELAPGHGRNTLRLMERARTIDLIDVNQTCIDACRTRLGDGTTRCRLRYHVGDGLSLAPIADASATLVYSWDSVVHFDREVVRRYVLEFARVLVPGGSGFIHHSNYAALCAEGEGEVWDENPNWRSNVSRELFARYCDDAGLEVIRQQLIPWFIEDLDCLSTFRKPA